MARFLIVAVNVMGPTCAGGDVGDMTALNLSPLSAEAGSANAVNTNVAMRKRNLRMLVMRILPVLLSKPDLGDRRLAAAERDSVNVEQSRICTLVTYGVKRVL